MRLSELIHQTWLKLLSSLEKYFNEDDKNSDQ